MTTRNFQTLAMALMLAACEENAPTVGEVLDSFKEASGLAFADCGPHGYAKCEAPGDAVTDDDFEDAAACIVAAWNECQAAEAWLTWNSTGFAARVRHLFVTPQDGACRLTYFEERGTSLDRYECEELVASGSCGILEPGACSRVGTIETAGDGPH